MADETDADLLVYMSLAGDDPLVARAAWEEFYRRHVEYLYAVCLRAYGRILGGAAGAADLVTETFRRAYERAKQFDAGGIADADRLRRRTRAWLGRIAERLMQTALRGRRRLPTRHLDADQWQQVAGPPAQADPGGHDERIRRVRAALLALSEREQIVLRVTFQWYQADRSHQRLPNDVAAELAATLDTTPENLRQIRRRALGKVRAMLRQPQRADAMGSDARRRPGGPSERRRNP